MALDYRRERNYASRLGDAADDLQVVRNKLNYILSNVQAAYKADERYRFDSAVNSIRNRINTISNELNDLEADISDVAYDIYREDKVKEARQSSGYGGGGSGF